MYKKILVTVLVLTMVYCLFADQKVINLTYNPVEFSYRQTNHGLQIGYSGSMNITNVNPIGAPNLPTHLVMVSVPIEAEFQSVSFSYSTIGARSDVIMAPSQPNIPFSVEYDSLNYVQPDPIYYDSTQYPENNCVYTSTQIMRTYKIFCFQISPFVYLPQTNQLQLIIGATLSINYSMTYTTNPNWWDDGSRGALIKDIVINPNDVIISSPRPPLDTDTKYLIITSQAMIDDDAYFSQPGLDLGYFQSYKDWKTLRGIKTEILSVDYINQNYPGNTIQQKIKRCVEYYYTNKHTDWVLFYGNQDHVPAQTCFVGMNDYATALNSHCYIQTDLYYACFDQDFNWNYEGFYCTYRNNVDLLPEVSIGRIATDSYLPIDDVSAFDKIKSYEQDPPTLNFSQNSLLTGSKLFYSFYTPSLRSDSDLICEGMWTRYMQPYWSIGARDRLFDTTSDFGNYITPANMSSAIGMGYNVILESTHGKTQYWQLGNDNNFYINGISPSNSSDNRFGLLYSIACLTNYFGPNQYNEPYPWDLASYELSLGSAFLAKSGGSIVYIGNTSYGWGNASWEPEDNNEDWGASWDYAKRFFPSLLGGNTNSRSAIGLSFDKAKALMLPALLPATVNPATNDVNLFIMFSLNLQGDPELNLLTNNPSEFSITLPDQVYMVEAEYNGYPLTINTGVEYSLVCISSDSDVYVSTYADNNGIATLNICPTTLNTINVTVTGKNKLPFFDEIPVLPGRGTVALESNPNNMPLSLIQVRLYNALTNTLVAETFTDQIGQYFFNNISEGDYYVEAEVFQPGLNEFYYPAQSSVFSFSSVPYSSALPLITLTRYNIFNLMLSCSTSSPYFKSINEALQRIQALLNNNDYFGAPIAVNLYAGEYNWPDTNPNQNGFTLSYTNGIQNSVNLKFRKVGNGIVVIKPYNAEQVNVLVNNINIRFENLKFNQGSTYSERCIYDMCGTGYSSYFYYNCIFGDNVIQYRNHRFWNTNNISFSGCTFQKCYGTYNGTIPGDWTFNQGILEFNNCNNLNIDYCNFTPDNRAAQSIISINNADNISISNSLFQNNTFGVNHFDTGTILISNCQNITISTNRLIGNLSIGGTASALNLIDSDGFNITGNAFSNYSQIVDSYQYMCEVNFNTCELDNEDIFQRNIFDDQGYYDNNVASYIRIDSWNNNSFNINNCNFIAHCINNKKVIQVAPLDPNNPNSARFNNCIFSNGNTSCNFLFECLSNQQVTVNNSIFDSNYNVVNNGVIIATNNMYYTNPGIDEGNVPIWMAAFKSPCIDNGTPDLNGNNVIWFDEPDNIDKDYDGTQLDIGAISYYDVAHKNGAIKLEKEEVWNWICIPAIDYPGGPRNADFETEVFDVYHNNRLFDNVNRTLEQIRWWYNDDKVSIYWQTQEEPYSFVYPPTVHHVRAQYGYKIELNQANPELPEIKPIEYTGFLPGGTGNPVVGMIIEPPIPDPTICFYNDLTQNWERETWLGYYLEKSLDPFDAFAPILNNIVSIKTQEWSIDRVIEDGFYTNQWEGLMTTEATLAFNYGEAVAVKFIGNEQAEFEWGNTYPIPPELPRFKRPKPQHFVFPKREDYLPIYATLDFSNIPPGEEPVEIAVYIDGECVGAEKIESTEIQIKAYLETDDITNFNDKLIEFSCWSPSKASYPTPEEFVIKNPVTNKYEKRNTLPEQIGNYLKVSLKAEDILSAQTPSITCLRNNYPNPFNPETTISFDLAKEGKVKLEIFNVKGQLIKTLVNESKDAGSFSVKWNGTNEKMRKVASGVYFYRLSTSGKTLTRKMLLLK